MSLDVCLYDYIECPHCHKIVQTEHVVFEANITHNLGTMADAADIYEILWRPDRLGPYIERIVRAIEDVMGFSCIIVTDESRLSDFAPDADDYAALARALEISIDPQNPNDSVIIRLALRLKNHAQRKEPE